MEFNSKWELMKEVAAANNVLYRTYLKRIYKGWSPEKAASTPPLPRHKDTEKPENPMGREIALKKIDEVVNEKCKPCKFRNRLDIHCLQECKVGKEIQELGKHLTVNPRKTIRR